MGRIWGKSFVGVAVALTCALKTVDGFALSGEAKTSSTAHVRVDDFASRDGYYYTIVHTTAGQTYTIYLSSAQIAQLNALGADDRKASIELRHDILQTFLDQVASGNLRSRFFDGVQTQPLEDATSVLAAKGKLSTNLLAGLTKLVSDRFFDLKKFAVERATELKTLGQSSTELYLNFAITADVMSGLSSGLSMLGASTGLDSLMSVAGDQEIGVNFGYDLIGKKWFVRLVHARDFRSEVSGRLFNFAVRASVDANFATHDVVYDQWHHMHRTKWDMGQGATLSGSTSRDANGRTVTSSLGATWAPIQFDIPLTNGEAPQPKLLPTSEKDRKATVLAQFDFSFQPIRLSTIPLSVARAVQSAKARMVTDFSFLRKVASSAATRAMFDRPQSRAGACAASSF